MLLDGKQFSDELVSAIKDSTHSLVAYSAFIKKKAIEHPSFYSALAGKAVTLVARWQKIDILSGASDLEVFEVCLERGWRFGIDLNLHGKVFLIDESEIFLGSSNLTQRGLHFGVVGNHEFGLRVPAGRADLEKLKTFTDSEVTWVDERLYSIIKNEIADASKSCSEFLKDWSPDVLGLISRPVQFLWAWELPFCSPEQIRMPNFENDNFLHDFALFGLNIDELDDQSLRNSFSRARVFQWLFSLLPEGGSLSFGAVTHALHSSLLDDPKPYRMDVKILCQNIFEWAKFMDHVFEVARPSYSQVIRLRT